MPFLKKKRVKWKKLRLYRRSQAWWNNYMPLSSSSRKKQNPNRVRLSLFFSMRQQWYWQNHPLAPLLSSSIKVRRKNCKRALLQKKPPLESRSFANYWQKGRHFFILFLGTIPINYGDNKKLLPSLLYNICILPHNLKARAETNVERTVVPSHLSIFPWGLDPASLLYSPSPTLSLLGQPSSFSS